MKGKGDSRGTNVGGAGRKRAVKKPTRFEHATVLLLFWSLMWVISLMFGFGTRVGLDEGMEVNVLSEKLSFVVLLRIRTWDEKGTERGGVGSKLFGQARSRRKGSFYASFSTVPALYPSDCSK